MYLCIIAPLQYQQTGDLHSIHRHKNKEKCTALNLKVHPFGVSSNLHSYRTKRVFLVNSRAFSKICGLLSKLKL